MPRLPLQMLIKEGRGVELTRGDPDEVLRLLRERAQELIERDIGVDTATPVGTGRDLPDGERPAIEVVTAGTSRPEPGIAAY